MKNKIQLEKIIKPRYISRNDKHASSTTGSFNNAFI